MSFQLGIGDVVLVSKLAWQIYQSCKTAPKELQSLSLHVLSISDLLRQIEDAFEELYLNKHQRRVLRRLISQCSDVLEEVQEIVNRYESLGTEKGRWKVLRWQLESDGIQQVKQQLMEQVSLLSNFNSAITIWSLAGIKKKLNRLVHEAPEPNALSDHDSATFQEASGLDWSQLHQELEEVGVAPEVIARNRQYFVAWIASAISQNEPPDKKLDEMWNKPEKQLCVFCGQEGHESEACEQMGAFDIDQRDVPLPLTIPEDNELPASPPPSMENLYRHNTAPARSSRKKLSFSSFGTGTTISAGFGPGSGPEVQLHHRPRPSSVSTDSDSSRTSRKISNDGSVATEPSPRKRPSLKSRISSRVSTLGASSPSAQHGFSV